MKITKELAETYKDHKAYYKDLGDIQVLDWKKDNTNYGYVRYVFDNNKLYVSGDYGHAVYLLTWKATLKSFVGLTLPYFYEKNVAYEDDKYDFDSKKAKADISDYLNFLVEDYNNYKEEKEEQIKASEEELDSLDKKEKDYDYISNEIKQDINRYKEEIADYYIIEKMDDKEELINGLYDIADESDTLENFMYNLSNSDIKDKLDEFDADNWEWIGSVGKVIPERIKLHLAGLELAYDYMKKNNMLIEE